MHENTIGTVMITQEEILRKAEEIGRQITEEYQGEEIVMVGILRGAVLWMADLMKNVGLDMTIDIMAVSSYGAATKTSGVVKINKDLDTDIDGKIVIVVEDIVDSGVTLNYLKGYFSSRGAREVRICTLLDKPDGRRVEIDVDYIDGMRISLEFSVIIRFGLSIRRVTKRLADDIRSAAEESLGLDVARITINIAGVRSRKDARRNTKVVFDYVSD